MDRCLPALALTAIVATACRGEADPGTEEPETTAANGTPGPGLVNLIRRQLSGVAQQRSRHDLIPSSAKTVLELDVKAFRDSGLDRVADAIIRSAGQRPIAVALGLARCEIDVERIAVGDFGGMVAILTGPDAGSPDKHRCVASELAGGDVAYAVVEDGGRTRIRIDGGNAGWLLDANTFVYVDAAGLGKVEALVEGRGESVAAGALGKLLGQVDRSKSAWVVTHAPHLLAGVQMWGGEFEAITITADVTNGLSLSATLATLDSARAETAADRLSNTWQGIKPSLGTIGLDERAADSLRFKARGSQVFVELRLDREQLGAVIDRVSGFL